MYIRRKLFSLLNVEGEERYFSTTDYIQDGEEVRLFARADYEGLSEAQKEVLRARRSEYAKNLLKNHRDTQAAISEVSTPGKGETSLGSRGSHRGGGVRSSFEVETHRGLGESKADYVSRHRKGVINQQLKNSSAAKNIMRSEVEKMGEVEAHAAARKVNPEFGKVTGEKLKTTAPAAPKNLPAVVEKKTAENVVKKGLSKNKKIALGVAAGTGIAAGGAYLYKRHKNKK